MDAILKYFTGNPQFLPVATAAIALIGVFLSAFVSAFVANAVSKRSAYITAVTAERSKWIDKLRSNIADLLGVCGAIHLSSSDKTSDKALEKRQNADRLIALITLQLNPNDKSGIDKELIELLPKLVSSSEKADNSYRDFEKSFVRYAQFLL